MKAKLLTFLALLLMAAMGVKAQAPTLLNTDESRVNVTGITLSQTSAQTNLGSGELTLIATVAPDDATDKTVTWTTSDASVATVANGVVTLVSTGDVTITATATNGTPDDTSDDKRATCSIKIKAPTLSTNLHFRIGSYNGEYVDWLTIRRNDTGVMMLSKYVLKDMQYGSNSTYTQSNIYKWLDANAGGTFENDLGLTSYERNVVKTVNLSGNYGDGTDRFIIPSYDTDAQELNKDMPYTKAYYINDKNTLCDAFWLRTPRDEKNPRVVRSSDETVQARYANPSTNTYGVRPIFYLNESAFSGLAIIGSGTEDNPLVIVRKYNMALSNTSLKGGTVSATASIYGKNFSNVSFPYNMAAGATVTITATPNAGYLFKDMKVTCNGSELALTGEGNVRKFTMPEGNVVLQVNYYPELTFAEATDNAEALTEWNGYEAYVTLTRTLQTGGWNTFCAPFSTETPSGWTVKQLTSSELNSSTGTLTLNFDNAASIEAGKPYLVKVTDTVANPVFEGVTVSSTTTTTETTAVDFVPVMNPMSLTGGDKSVLFVTGGNKLTYPTADGNINAFRAYFQLKGETASLARAFRMSFDDNVTGIVTVLSGEPTTSSGIYTLDGRRLQGQPAAKGVYIVNGKKTIIK